MNKRMDTETYLEWCQPLAVKCNNWVPFIFCTYFYNHFRHNHNKLSVQTGTCKFNCLELSVVPRFGAFAFANEKKKS